MSFAHQPTVRVSQPVGARPLVPVLGLALLRVLLGLALLITALTVALLPISTSVPAYIWLLLAVAVVALAVTLFWHKWTPRALGAAGAGSFLVVLLAVVASQALAATPPITDARGQPIPNSIAALEKSTSTAASSGLRCAAKISTTPCC